MQMWTSTSGLWCTAARECRTVTPFTSGLGTRTDGQCLAAQPHLTTHSHHHRLTRSLTSLSRFALTRCKLTYVCKLKYLVLIRTYVRTWTHLEYRQNCSVVNK